jgi:lipoyl(octanoyl) transferase
MSELEIRELGMQDYRLTWELQRELVRSRVANPDLPDCLILVEHPPVYTLGTGSTLAHLKFPLESPPHPVYRSERGGEVTYHCPRQLVIYPILNLRRHRQDLHWYLRQLEEVVIDTLAAFDIRGDRLSTLTGVWVENSKVAAIGIKVSKWITMHGIALNVDPDLTGFESIVPCGITHLPVGKMSQFNPSIDFHTVKERTIVSFCRIFHFSQLTYSGKIVNNLELL